MLNVPQTQLHLADLPKEEREYTNETLQIHGNRDWFKWYNFQAMYKNVKDVGFYMEVAKDNMESFGLLNSKIAPDLGYDFSKNSYHMVCHYITFRKCWDDYFNRKNLGRFLRMSYGGYSMINVLNAVIACLPSPHRGPYQPIFAEFDKRCDEVGYKIDAADGNKLRASSFFARLSDLCADLKDKLDYLFMSVYYGDEAMYLEEESKAAYHAYWGTPYVEERVEPISASTDDKKMAFGAP